MGNCDPCNPQPQGYYEQPTCEKKEPIIFREYQKVEQPAPTPTPAHRDEFYRVMPEPVNQDVEYSHLDFEVVVVKSMDELRKIQCDPSFEVIDCHVEEPLPQIQYEYKTKVVEVVKLVPRCVPVVVQRVKKNKRVFEQPQFQMCPETVQEHKLTIKDKCIDKQIVNQSIRPVDKVVKVPICHQRVKVVPKPEPVEVQDQLV